jgi:hypothetical protein
VTDPQRDARRARMEALDRLLANTAKAEARRDLEVRDADVAAAAERIARDAAE